MGLHYSVHQSLFFGRPLILLKSSIYMSCNDVILHTCFSFQSSTVLNQLLQTRLIPEILIGFPFVVSVSRRDLKVIFVEILALVLVQLIKVLCVKKLLHINALLVMVRACNVVDVPACRIELHSANTPILLSVDLSLS